jgi:hypothetical protein
MLAYLEVDDICSVIHAKNCLTYLRSILILSSHLCLVLPSGLFPLGFPTNILYKFLTTPCVLHDPCPILLDLTILFTTTYRPPLGPTQPPVQLVPGALSLEVKRPGREANYSPPSSAEIKECVELYLRFRNTSSWRGAQLKRHRGNFTFTFFNSSW